MHLVMQGLILIYCTIVSFEKGKSCAKIYNGHEKAVHVLDNS